MRKFLGMAAAFALMFVTAPAVLAQDAPMEIKGAKTVNADAIVELIKKTSNLVILDNRSDADYKAGSIKEAVRLIDTDITSEAVLAQHVKTKDTPILFYCNGLKCGRAAKASVMAVGWGYKNVYYYALGMEEWKQRSLPLVTH
jgi:rhodanese-related sulfurtransferase